MENSNSKNVIITGATGMVGSLVLEHCLNSVKITNVISLVRKSSGQKHQKLKEVVIKDFTDYSEHKELFENIDIAFFCIGVYTGQVSDELFKEITVDYAVNFAKAVKEQNPDARYCMLSGAGADRSEKSRTAFARYKGMAENAISDLGLQFYTFRPGYIYPVTPRKEPSIMYRIMRFCYPLIRLVGSGGSIKSTELAEAMFYAGLNGVSQEVLENRDILALT